MKTSHLSPLIGRLLVLGVVLVGIALFSASLAFDAAQFTVVNKSSAEMLMLGWMGPLGLHFGWYANLLLPSAWLLALVLKRPVAIGAMALGILTLLVGLTSFYTLGHFSVFGRHENETAGDLVRFLPGIYLWTASLATGLFAGVASFVLAQLAIPPGE
ncbi:MAG: hypothetical protein AB8I08_20400 [Sandaracinaceae bacterium]